MAREILVRLLSFRRLRLEELVNCGGCDFASGNLLGIELVHQVI